MSAVISTIDQLEACVGVAGLPVRMKIIDHLDITAQNWIAASPIAFAGFGGAEGPAVTIAGGAPGFATVKDDKILRLPRAALDGDVMPERGQGAGVLVLVPGIGETLRANGHVAAVDGDAVEIAVEECFVHCAKALIRSDFWNAAAADTPSDALPFLNASRFLALATMDKDGRVDVSPKGDPAGFLLRGEGTRAILAERPGNKLAFGYRNIVEQPMVAAVSIIPGSANVASIRGRAQLTTDEPTRGAFAVAGKTPILTTVLEDVHCTLWHSPALARAALWNGHRHPADIDPAATLVAHLKLNKERGAQATMLRLAATRGIVANGLQSDYTTRLY